eukprot:COSAG01_NODE_1467_length_10217_cov_33.824570_11_plen_74_part_00
MSLLFLSRNIERQRTRGQVPSEASELRIVRAIAADGAAQLAAVSVIDGLDSACLAGRPPCRPRSRARALRSPQ